MVAFPDGIGMDEARELVGPVDQLHDAEGYKIGQPWPLPGDVEITIHVPCADTPETIIARTLQDLLCGGQPITTELMVNTIVTDLRIAGWLPQEDD